MQYYFRPFMAVILCSTCSSLFAETQAAPSSAAPIEEIIVLGDRKGDFTIITENAQKLVDVPGAIGDPLSAVFSLPGVVPSGNGGEPAVRGSSPADNLYTVDFLPAGYIFHNFSSSIFSEYILQDFQLYSAGFGPSYSNVTGATFDITLRDPKNQRLGGTVDLSLLRSGLFLEGGVTENSAFYLSARKSLIHLIVDEQTDQEAEEDGEGIRVIEAPQDEDYQFKYVWDISDSHQLAFSANGATDYVEAELTRQADFVAVNPDFAGNAKIEQDYDGQQVVYQYLGNTISSAKLAVGRNSLDGKTYWGDGYHSFFNIDNNLLKGEMNFEIFDDHVLTLGSQLVDGEYTLDYEGVLLLCSEDKQDQCGSAERVRVSAVDTLDIRESTFYINDTWHVTDRTRIDLGVQSYYNDLTEETLTLPRVGLGFQATRDLELNARYGHYARLPEIELAFPSIGNPDLPTAKAKHSVIGLKKLYSEGWSWNLELYHKTLSDLAIANSDASSGEYYINALEGEASGLDLLINKDLTDKWYGWLALSYGKSERTNILTNETRDYYLDTPWLATWVMNYQFRDNMDIGWRWSLRSGEAYTPIIGLEAREEDVIVPVYGEPFSGRLPTYSRLDIRYKWDFNIGRFPSALIVDVINALDQENIDGRNLDYDKIEDENSPVVTEDTAGLGIIPTVGFRISF
ncbi:MAG TPA: TonB-dependent receptor [Marinagarivorans sp.]